MDISSQMDLDINIQIVKYPSILISDEPTSVSMELAAVLR